MIKVLIERKVKRGEDISRFLRELRTTAIHEPGYMTGETLVNPEDASDVLVISTWQDVDRWRTWEASKARARLYKRIQPFLREEPTVTLYNVLATEAPATTEEDIARLVEEEV